MKSSAKILIKTLVSSLEDLCLNLNLTNDSAQKNKALMLEKYKIEILNDAFHLEESNSLLCDHLAILKGVATRFSSNIGVTDRIQEIALIHSYSKVLSTIKQLAIFFELESDEPTASIKKANTAESATLKDLDTYAPLNNILNQLSLVRKFQSLESSFLSYGSNEFTKILQTSDEKMVQLNIVSKILNIREAYLELHRRIEIENGHVSREMIDTNNNPERQIEAIQMINKSIGLVKLSRIDDLIASHKGFAQKVENFIERCTEAVNQVKDDVSKFKGDEGVVFLLSEIQSRVNFFESLTQSIKELDLVIVQAFQTLNGNTQKLLHVNLERKKTAEATKLGLVATSSDELEQAS